MSADFDRTRGEWRDRVSRDARVSALAFRAAFRISEYFSRKNGEAWPSQERLAGECGCSVRHLRRALEELVERGHLTVVRVGKRRPSVYRMAHGDRTPVSPHKDGGDGTPMSSHQGIGDRTHTSGHEGAGDRTPVSGHGGTVTGQDRRGDRTPVSSVTGHPCPPNLSERTFLKKEPLPPEQGAARETREDDLPRVDVRGSDAKAIAPPASGPAALVAVASNPPATAKPPDEIAEAWQQLRGGWPNQGSSWREARDLFRKRVRQGDATINEILAGAEHYAAACQSRRPEMIADLANWLRRCEWEARPPIRQRPEAAGHGGGQLERVMGRLASEMA